MGVLFLGTQEICPIREAGGNNGVPREVSSSGVYQIPATSFTFSLPDGATKLGSHSFSYAFIASTGLTYVDMSTIVSVSGTYTADNMCYNCTNLTTVNLSALETVSGSYAFYYAFYGCSGLTSVDLSSLKTVSASNGFSNAFYNCTSLTSFSLPKLETASGSSCFYFTWAGCTGLTSMSFTKLSTLTGSQALTYAFYNCTSLTSVSFPALTTSSFSTRTNQFNNMLTGCTGVTVHFPAAIQSTIGSWSSVTGGFGGTNTTVLYDL